MFRHYPALLALLTVGFWPACSDQSAAEQGSQAEVDTDVQPVAEVSDDAPAATDTAGEDAKVPTDGESSCDGGCAHLDGPSGGCVAGICNGQRGQCEVGPRPVGVSCDDGKACTTGDACDAGGVCKGTLSCPGQEPCGTPACAPDGSCALVPVAGPCNDGNACTSGDICQFGSCTGVPVVAATVCDDGDPCTADPCEPVAGCVHLPESASQACDDGDLCTKAGNCDGKGGCEIGPPIDCDDGDPCTADGCVPGAGPNAGCSAVELPQGATCDDASKCTAGDSCQEGQCVGELIENAQPSTTCTKLICNPKTAAITIAHAEDGIACSDGAACTIADHCKAGGCSGSPLVCNDGNACTSESCDPASGSCVVQSKSDGQACDDGDGCTSQDECDGGACLGKGYQDTGHCDDDNPCTNDDCAPPSGCFHLPKGDVACDDGQACTLLDSCVGATCKGKAKACDDQAPCTKDSCVAGLCEHVAFVGPCDDGDACTTDTLCVQGKCTGPAVDCGDANPCTSDLCLAATGCKNTPLPGGTPCDDGLSCTSGDACDSGSCKGVDKCVGCTNDVQCLEFQPIDACLGKIRCVDSFKGKVCALDPATKIVCADNGDPCTSQACDPGSGVCKKTLSLEGLDCISADKCVVQAACNGQGKCVGSQLSCDDKQPCTDDSCEPKWGCKHEARPDGSDCKGATCLPAGKCLAGVCGGANPCSCAQDADCVPFDDGNLCNGVLACVKGPAGGTCAPKAGSAVVCAPTSQPCAANQCDVATGACKLTAVAEGAACDDGDACTVKDACNQSKCSGNTLKCDLGDPCRIYVCDKVFGCNDGPQIDGGVCNDGNPCTASDACIAGKCQGKNVACEDGNPCTVDLCAAGTGACTFLVNDSAKCSDGEPCTAGDSCVDGKCVAKALACDDGDACTIDGCDGQGGCKHILVPGKDCDDGDPCTLTDRCELDGTCAGKTKACDDANGCTVDICVKGACVVTPEIGKKCSDGDACTHTDRCDPQGACVSLPVDCDDGNPCTAVVAPCSAKSGCAIGVSDGKSCNDGDLCTIADKCAGAACQGIKLPCDDGNGCTVDKCAPKTGCVNSQNPCDDGNDCTFDKCDPPPPVGGGAGCLNPVVNGFQPCSDGSKCTTGGACNGADCEAKLVPCDDNNPCTEDACDAGAGCIHMASPATATCADGDPCAVGACDGKGKCIATAKVCDDDNPCTQNDCHPTKGCFFVPLKEGADCDDGCACTQAEQCQGGFCSGGKVICALCPKPADGGCAIYDDNNPCNGGFECRTDGPCGKVAGISGGGGVCVDSKAPVVCDPLANGPCLKNSCQLDSGECAMKQLVNGTPCDDGVPCTVGDLCLGGQCGGGQPADCSALADDCNLAACVTDPGDAKGYHCVALPRSGTAVYCNADDDGCTAHDHCLAGKCVAGKAVDCGGIAGPCELAKCATTGPQGFTCKIEAAKDGTPCEDGQHCTSGDTCQVGKCVTGPGTPDCGALDGACAKGFCDPKGNGGSGACMPKAIAENGPCNADDNGCTVGDLCVKGQCVPGAWPDCTAKSSPCGLGACKSTGSGTWACIATPTNELKPCEADNNGCTQGDRCQGGACAPGPAKDCSALDGGGGCTIGTCASLSASQAECKGVAAQPGTACNADDNGCTQGDQCNKDGACMNGAPVNCLAFGGTCATGQCVPDAADPDKFSCQGAAKPDGQACDADGDGCSVDDACKSGQCLAGKPADCSAQSQGACVVGGCANKGSDKYLCQPTTRPNGTPCDADGDGCTTPDACVGGGCAKGSLKTCKEFSTLCADAWCKSGGPSAWDCVVAPKGSWPPLDPPQPCTPTDKPVQCPANYNCISLNKEGLGQCAPSATIACDDGDACTAGDVCADGACLSGPGLDCDDDNPCTLDLCLGGQCGHKPLKDCSLCIDEGFDATAAPGAKPVLPSHWVSAPGRLDYAAFGLSPALAFGGSKLAVRATWQGPYDGGKIKQITSRLLHRRLHLAGAALLEFQLAMTVATQSCDRDNLQVLINDVLVWQRCGDTDPGKVAGGFEKVSVDLTAWANAPIDLAFRVLAGTDKSAGGTVVIDAIKLSGNCGPACIGAHFEPGDANEVDGGVPAPQLPQAWQILSTAAPWLTWKLNTVGVHSGKFALRAAWTGPAPGGKAQTSRLRIPMITPSLGNQLRFALRTEALADSSCDDDRLRVSVSDQVVVQACAAQPGWKIMTVDLSPWAGKIVDLEFVVRGGATKDSAGQVAIDDISITGACTWACFHERFDDAGLTAWKPTAPSSTAPGWVYGQKLAKSPPGAAQGVIGAGAKLSSAGHLIADASKGGRVQIPVLGASYSYAANLAMTFGAKGADDLCAAGKGGEPLWPLTFSLQRFDAQMPAPAEDPSDLQDAFTMATHCKATSGWQTFTGKIDAKAADSLPSGPRGLALVPAIDLYVVAAPAQAEVWLDDLLILCR